MGQISDPARGEAGSAPSRRRAERALQAVAFDAIGERYSEAFPAKEGQLAAGRLLLDELRPGDRVLDIGCGTGDPTVRQLAAGGLLVTAVDLSDGMLSLARRTFPQAAAYHRMDLYDLATVRAGTAWGLPELGPAGAGSFAAATAFFSLILLPQQEIRVALGRIRRLLRPGGLLALGLVEADLDDCRMHFLGHPLRISGFLREELVEVLHHAGFTVEALNGRPYAPACTALPPEEQLFLHCRRTT
ncbi:class I SAM-dependent methyltransferase [Kitasatospora viridis]|uniref:Methyltransferase family protein n=1 Tax=Kitasatospora viridis TaxID=281105 RepID=A0A561UFM0_9ACTN|nr:methyltransferase domain-containing protein [Kitasatospora viridis]TWF98150.1 methyltransferase family protein [Kitasatospora viridis]